MSVARRNVREVRGFLHDVLGIFVAKLDDVTGKEKEDHSIFDFCASSFVLDFDTLESMCVTCCAKNFFGPPTLFHASTYDTRILNTTEWTYLVSV